MSGRDVDVARAMPGGWFGLRTRRTMMLALASAVAIGMAGCGGGADLQGDGFSLGVTIDGINVSGCNAGLHARFDPVRHLAV